MFPTWFAKLFQKFGINLQVDSCRSPSAQGTKGIQEFLKLTSPYFTRRSYHVFGVKMTSIMLQTLWLSMILHTNVFVIPDIVVLFYQSFMLCQRASLMGGFSPTNLSTGSSMAACTWPHEVCLGEHDAYPLGRTWCIPPWIVRASPSFGLQLLSAKMYTRHCNRTVRFIYVAFSWWENNLHCIHDIII